MNSRLSIQISNPLRIYSIGALVMIVLAVTILQDIIQSYANHYSFYFSESLLFKSFWIIFIPLSISIQHILNKNASSAVSHKVLVSVSTVVIATFVHIVFFSFTVFSISAIFLDHTYDFVTGVYYAIADDLYKCILIYGGMTMFQLLYDPKSTREDMPMEIVAHKQVVQSTFIVRQGKKNICIDIESVLYLASDTPYVSIHTKTGKYLQLASLTSIHKEFGENFIKIHKSTFVNVNQVSSYMSRLNGDYDLRLSNNETIRLSRTYAAYFKERIKLPPTQDS